MLTVTEAAKFLGVSASKLYELARHGRIAHYRIDRKILFKLEDLTEFARVCRIGVGQGNRIMPDRNGDSPARPRSLIPSMCASSFSSIRVASLCSLAARRCQWIQMPQAIYEPAIARARKQIMKRIVIYVVALFAAVLAGILIEKARQPSMFYYVTSENDKLVEVWDTYLMDEYQRVNAIDPEHRLRFVPPPLPPRKALEAKH